MDRKTRRNKKIRKTTPQCNTEECFQLIDLLFQATKGNTAYCCRLLEISRPTWYKWIKEPPTAWYWPMVIRAAIKHVLSQVVAQRRMTSTKWRRSIKEALNAIPESKEWELEIAEMAYDAQGAERHLRDLLAARGKWWSDIQKTANSGGYSKVMLRRAAKNIGIIMKQEGYGADKDSYWRLPNEDDD